MRDLESGFRVLNTGLNHWNWEFPKIRGTSFWPYNKDPTILGTILGSPIFGNSQLGYKTMFMTRNTKEHCD